MFVRCTIIHRVVGCVLLLTENRVPDHVVSEVVSLGSIRKNGDKELNRTVIMFSFVKKERFVVDTRQGRITFCWEFRYERSAARKDYSGVDMLVCNPEM